MRSQASRILTEHVHIRPAILRKAAAFYATAILGRSTSSPHHAPTAAERAAGVAAGAADTRPLLGVHVRGTDKIRNVGGRIIKPAEYALAVIASLPVPTTPCLPPPLVRHPAPATTQVRSDHCRVASAAPRRPDLCRDRLAVLCRRAHRDARLRGCGHVRRYSFGEKCLRRLIAHRQLQKGRGRAGGGADPELRKLPRETGTHRDASRTAHAASSSLPRSSTHYYQASALSEFAVYFSPGLHTHTVELQYELGRPHPNATLRASVGGARDAARGAERCPPFLRPYVREAANAAGVPLATMV